MEGPRDKGTTDGRLEHWKMQAVVTAKGVGDCIADLSATAKLVRAETLIRLSYLQPLSPVLVS
jgi:hypothetical protein